MPQQNLGEEKHLIDHPDECLGVSEVFFSLLCRDKQNSADDAAACFVKDDDIFAGIRVGEPRASMRDRRAAVCPPVSLFIGLMQSRPAGG